MVNDNGIITTLNPETGAVIKQGRLDGALGPHFASPVRADGHIFFTHRSREPSSWSRPAAISRRSPSISSANDTYATPAFADGRLYVRYHSRAVCVREPLETSGDEARTRSPAARHRARACHRDLGVFP
jgi:hypothetical protein